MPARPLPQHYDSLELAHLALRWLFLHAFYSLIVTCILGDCEGCFPMCQHIITLTQLLPKLDRLLPEKIYMPAEQHLLEREAVLGDVLLVK